MGIAQEVLKEGLINLNFNCHLVVLIQISTVINTY